MRPFRRLKKGLLRIENALLGRQDRFKANRARNKEARWIKRMKKGVTKEALISEHHTKRIERIQKRPLLEHKQRQQKQTQPTTTNTAKKPGLTQEQRMQAFENIILPKMTMSREILTRTPEQKKAVPRNGQTQTQRTQTDPRKIQTTKWVRKQLARKETRKFVTQTYASGVALPDKITNRLTKIHKNQGLNDYKKLVQSRDVLEKALKNKKNKIIQQDIKTALTRVKRLIDSHKEQKKRTVGST